MKPTLYSYLKPIRHVCIVLYAPIFLFLMGIAAANLLTDIPISKFTGDPLSMAGLNPLFGIASNLGVLAWCSAAAICFFSAVMINRHGDRVGARFLWISGLLTTLLLIDDFFMVHESLRDYFGIPENITYAAYLIFIAGYLAAYRKQIFNRNVLLLALAFGFLGMSLLFDILSGSRLFALPGYYLFEDGFKLLGIASWAAYFAVTASDIISMRFAGKPASNA